MSRLTQPLSRRTMGVLTGAAALAFLAVAAYAAWGVRAEMSGWQRATGSVVRYAAFSSGGKSSARAVVRFKTAAGLESELISRGGSSTGALGGGYRIGQTLPVLYDPANLSRARIDSLGEVWLRPLMALVPGLALLLASVLMLVLGAERWSTHDPGVTS